MKFISFFGKEKVMGEVVDVVERRKGNRVMERTKRKRNEREAQRQKLRGGYGWWGEGKME